MDERPGTPSTAGREVESRRCGMESSTSDEERARAMAVNSTDDTTRVHSSADETEQVTTNDGGLRPVPPPPGRADQDASRSHGWPGEDSEGQRADG